MGVVVTTDDAWYDRLPGVRTLVGAIPARCVAEAARSAHRALRVRESQATARPSLARRLQATPLPQPALPGLPTDPATEVAARWQMTGFGPIIAFETVGDVETAERVCDATRLVVHATSPRWRRDAARAAPPLVEERPTSPRRSSGVSVGIEDATTSGQTPEQALDTVPPESEG